MFHHYMPTLPMDVIFNIMLFDDGRMIIRTIKLITLDNQVLDIGTGGQWKIVHIQESAK
jgi:hypothetical protein